MLENTERYMWMDGCYGEVIGTCYSGAFLKLDNGEEAFAYGFSNLRIGSKVLCTVRRQAREDKRKLVMIDSVIKFAPMAA